MIDLIFHYCVLALMYLAYLLGTTYEAVNVWIFVFIWPVLTVIMIGIIIWQHRRIQVLTAQRKRIVTEAFTPLERISIAKNKNHKETP